MVDAGPAPEATEQDEDVRRWSTDPVTLARLSAALRRQLDASRAATAAGLPAAGMDCRPGGDCRPVDREADARILRDLGAMN
jgi:hypothetical protein